MRIEAGSVRLEGVQGKHEIGQLSAEVELSSDLSRADLVSSEAAWDGVGEIWFDSIADAEAAFASEPCRSLLIADRKLILAEVQACFVIEHTDVPPPDGR